MENSYFHKPAEIYKTLDGFLWMIALPQGKVKLSSGYNDLRIFAKLSESKNLRLVSRYLRFWDDISMHLIGDPSGILDVIKITVNRYSDAIQLNIETRSVYGKFLNIWIFNYLL